MGYLVYNKFLIIKIVVNSKRVCGRECECVFVVWFYRFILRGDGKGMGGNIRRKIF